MNTTDNILPPSPVAHKPFNWGVLLTYALLLCPFFISHPQNGISHLVERVLQVFCVGLWCVCGYLMLRRRHRATLSRRLFSGLIHVWWLYMITNTFVQVQTRQLTLIYQWLAVWCILLLAELYWTRDYKRHMYYIGVLFSMLVYLNVVLYILFPGGLWVEENWLGTGDPTRYLFGNYNQTGLFSLIAIMVWGIYVLTTRRGYLNMLLLIICSLAVIILMGSMTSAVGLLIVSLYFLFQRIVKHPFRWIVAFFVVYVAFFVLVIWQGENLKEWPALKDLVVNVLHKDTTFSFRVPLWLNSVTLIKIQPWQGYGVQDIEWMVKSIGGSGPHNLWLMTLLRGGVVSTVLLAVSIALIYVRLWLTKCAAGAHAAVCLSVLMLMSLFETYYIICLFFVLIMAYYVQPAAKIKPGQSAATDIGQTEENKIENKQ